MRQENVAELVDKIPPLDKGGTFTAPPWEEAIAPVHPEQFTNVIELAPQATLQPAGFGD